MQNFMPLDDAKKIYFEGEYINFSTNREDGFSHPSNVRIVHGHSLSLYFLSEDYSTKSKNIARDPRVSGSMQIEKPEPGKGVNFYFNGVAQIMTKDNDDASFLPIDYEERKKVTLALCEGREDYQKNKEAILADESETKLHRILLTHAWYNGGVTKDGKTYENNATRTLNIVGDKSIPLVRRYFVPADEPVPDYAIDLPYTKILLNMAAPGARYQ